MDDNGIARLLFVRDDSDELLNAIPVISSSIMELS